MSLLRSWPVFGKEMNTFIFEEGDIFLIVSAKGFFRTIGVDIDSTPLYGLPVNILFIKPVLTVGSFYSLI